MSWKTLKSEEVLANPHVSVRKDMVKLPDGAVIEDFYTVTIPDAAMVCALTSDGDILLKTEYRYAIGTDVIECPAGMFDEGEKDPFVVAKRELLESTSKLTNRMHLFLARDCVKVAEQKLDSKSAAKAGTSESSGGQTKNL